MRITKNIFGTLVRPRITSYAKLFPRISPLLTQEESKDLYLFIRDYSYGYNHLAMYNNDFNSLFNGLTLGDTSKDLSNCYVGQITSLIISIGYKNFIIVKENNYDEAFEKYKKYYGNRTFLDNVYYVGLKYFQGLELNKDTNKLIPINPWHETMKTEYGWFYKQYDLLPMETIIQYENVQMGDLLWFKYTNGLALNVKTLNKQRFYMANSWTCKNISILNNKGKIQKIPANRIFKK